MEKSRNYRQVVPEALKEKLSRSWGEGKSATFAAADKLGLEIEQGKSFNKVVTFALKPGYYHIVSGIVSVEDIAKSQELSTKVSSIISAIVGHEKAMGCTPLCASNVCDWDSAHANSVGADITLKDALLNSCIADNIVLTGGETANLGDQLRGRGMSWMFTLLSRFDSELVTDSASVSYELEMDAALSHTFGYLADKDRFGIVHRNGMPLLHVKEKSRFVMTADGTGSKSIVCELIGERADINDTLAMAGDDPTRDGAFPILASIGVHFENSEGSEQILRNMIRAGKKHQIPLVGSTFHTSGAVSTYTMNGVVLSEVRRGIESTAEELQGLDLVLLYEEQRSNGITLQRRVLGETFGPSWYNVKVPEAMERLAEKLFGRYNTIPGHRTTRTLGQLVAQPSTPYFRVDSRIPKDLLETIKLRVNVSSGGITGKTMRALEPLNLGAEYLDLFEVPELTLILQMASRIDGSKGAIPDNVAYYTWGCGNGSIIGTTCPGAVVDYYRQAGIPAKIGGKIIKFPEIRILSRAFDSMQSPIGLIHRYTDIPLG